jgi:hypothetical protein
LEKELTIVLSQRIQIESLFERRKKELTIVLSQRIQIEFLFERRKKKKKRWEAQDVTPKIVALPKLCVHCALENADYTNKFYFVTHYGITF